MRKRRHALSGALYEVGADGNVYVEKDGRRGVFTPRGQYLSGDLYSRRPAHVPVAGGAAGPRWGEHEGHARPGGLRRMTERDQA